MSKSKSVQVHFVPRENGPERLVTELPTGERKRASKSLVEAVAETRVRRLRQIVEQIRRLSVAPPETSTPAARVRGGPPLLAARVQLPSVLFGMPCF